MTFKKIPLFFLFAIWAISHLAIVNYGTQLVPLHTYHGSADEQAPLLGVMHMAEARSLFGMYGHDSVYYGPVFSVIAAPAVALDFARAYWAGHVRTANDYKIWFSFNWGEVLFWARWAAVFIGFLGLVYAWRFLSLPIINPGGKAWIAGLGVLLLATNFYYFLYSGWLRHWIFLSVFFIMQAYYLVQIKERNKKSDWIWLAVISVLSFGIGYVSLVFQIMWLPILAMWYRAKDYKKFKIFAHYVLALVIMVLLIVAWNVTPYVRYMDRYLNLSTGPGLRFMPQAMPSVVYYLKIIILNQPFLSAGFALVFIAIFLLQKRYKSYWTWILILGGLIHFALFAANAHSEPRYIVPTIFAILLLTAGLLASWDASCRHKRLVVLAAGLLCLEIVWQTTNGVLWSRGALRGTDDQEVVNWLRALPPGQKVLVDAWHLLGVAHSKEIIKNYALMRFGDKELSNMLTFFSETDPPAWTRPIANIDYSFYGKAASGQPRDKFDYFVYYTGEPLATNYFEERLTRLWYLPDLRLKYFIVKNKKL